MNEDRSPSVMQALREGPGNANVPADWNSKQEIVDREPLLSLLNQFLEGERAGARTARKFAAEAKDPRLASLMRRVAKDEAWCCAMLTRQIRRLNGRPSRNTGDFFENAITRNGVKERLDYLNRGQSWVIRKITELMPEIDDRRLLKDLRHMLNVHERNVSRCEKFEQQ